MATSRSLHRVLRIRRSEEEQLRKALESAQAELLRLLQAQQATAERDRCARALVHASAQSGELRDRLAGLEEARTATRQEIALSIRIAAAGRELAEARGCYMAKRTERRQVETLIEAAESEERLLDSRRNQQALDDGYRSSGHRTRS